MNLEDVGGRGAAVRLDGEDLLRLGIVGEVREGNEAYGGGVITGTR